MKRGENDCCWVTRLAEVLRDGGLMVDGSNVALNCCVHRCLLRS